MAHVNAGRLLLGFYIRQQCQTEFAAFPKGVYFCTVFFSVAYAFALSLQNEIGTLGVFQPQTGCSQLRVGAGRCDALLPTDDRNTAVHGSQLLICWQQYFEH